MNLAEINKKLSETIFDMWNWKVNICWVDIVRLWDWDWLWVEFSTNSSMYYWEYTRDWDDYVFWNVLIWHDVDKEKVPCVLVETRDLKIWDTVYIQDNEADIVNFNCNNNYWKIEQWDKWWIRVYYNTFKWMTYTQSHIHKIWKVIPLLW
jgi:hypothetical protein